MDYLAQFYVQLHLRRAYQIGRELHRLSVVDEPILHREGNILFFWATSNSETYAGLGFSGLQHHGRVVETCS